MPASEVEAKHEPSAMGRNAAPPPEGEPYGAPRARRRILPLIITLLAATTALGLGRVIWNVYVAAPWTRDGTVRAYVVTVAPEVAGRIVELPIADNQFVHRGDLLMGIDPTNYGIAVSQSAAAVKQAHASVRNIDALLVVGQARIRASRAQLLQAQAALVFAQQQAARYVSLAEAGDGSVQEAQQYTTQLHEQQAAVQTASANLALSQRQLESLRARRMSAEGTLAQTEAQLGQARVNLRRTRVLSPADGYVTNLLAHIGDYANIGANTISVVDARSYWVEGYFDETSLEAIKVGDPAEAKLMGYPQAVRGHVASITRAINVANAEPGVQGVATVNPIFTWVRLAQRIPVRIHIDHVPRGVSLVAGMTATVQIDPPEPR